MSVLSDLAIAILPIPIIWQTQIARRDKILLSLVFLSGLVAFVVALIRWILAIVDLTSDDRPWKAGLSFLFSILEINTGIICGCMATLKPLVRLTRVRSGRPHLGTANSRKEVVEREQQPLTSSRETFVEYHQAFGQILRKHSNFSTSPTVAESQDGPETHE